MNESKKKDRYEDAKKFVRYSDGAKMYSMGVIKLVSLYLLIQKYWISILKLFILQILSFISR